MSSIDGRQQQAGIAPTHADRRFLYWGVFFLALGAVLVAVQLHLIDEAPVVDALRLWPAVIVALGVAIVVRHTPASLGAWLVAATLPGLFLGGAIAAGPRVTLDCTDRGRPILSSQAGMLESAATVDVSTACGSLAVATQPGSGWRLGTHDPGRATATVSSSSTRLNLDGGTTGSLSVGTTASTTWDLTLPTSPVGRLRLAVSAGNGTFDLAGARITDLTISGTGTDTRADLSHASVARLSAAIRLGALSLRLPDADLTGSLDVTIGEIRVCLPPDVGLRVHRASELGVVKYQGFEQHAAEWQSPGYEQAPSHIDLTVTPDLGGIEFDPIGGCR